MRNELNVTVGALLLGVLVTAVGYGITTMQTYLYFTRFPNDPRRIRWVVWALLLLDTGHVTLSWHMIYYYLVLNFDNRPALEDSVWSFDLTIVITAVITVVVHCFYARRVFLLGNRNWALTISILVLSAVRIVFGCIVTARIYKIKNLVLLPKMISPLVGTGLGAGTLADCVITGSLVYFLRRHRTDFNKIDSLLDKITFWTVNNGLLTSIVGIAVIVTFSVMPSNMIFLSVHLLLSKLYANSLLATLNFRKAHRGRGFDDTTTTTMPMAVLSAARELPSHTHTTIQFNKNANLSTGTYGPPVVHINTTTTTVSDVADASAAGLGLDKPIRSKTWS